MKEMKGLERERKPANVIRHRAVSCDCFFVTIQSGREQWDATSLHGEAECFPAGLGEQGHSRHTKPLTTGPLLAGGLVLMI